MIILVGSDEATDFAKFTVSHLKELGHDVQVAGHLKAEDQKWRWAEIGREVAIAKAEGKCDLAILMCWSGTGVSIAANKISGVRAALCSNSETARLARKWDDANILCLSLRTTSEQEGKEIIDAFFNTSFDEEDLNQVRYIE